jgi:hypothetical protein
MMDDVDEEFPMLDLRTASPENVTEPKQTHAQLLPHQLHQEKLIQESSIRHTQLSKVTVQRPGVSLIESQQRL